MSRSRNRSASVRRAERAAGFTLIELMVVIIIIAVIISIVLPALAGVRRRARTAATLVMMTRITAAAGVFANDKQGKMPGYFSAREMGFSDNLTQGFSAMQNVMLDLAGGVVAAGSQPQPLAGDVLVGPGTQTAQQVWVRPDLMGSSGTSTDKLYFVPDAKHWVAQDTAGQQVGIAANVALRSVVDDFSNPLLAWVIDDTAVGQITQLTDFAKDKLNNLATDRSARFYGASNAAFLGASGLGARSYSQTDPTNGSMIQLGTTASDLENSLCGILGSPSFPYRAPAATAAPTIPAAARAPFVVHSAGADGIYFGKKDRGAKQFTQPYIDYQMGFVNQSGQAEAAPYLYTDKDGKRETLDVIKLFDDIIATGGN